MGRRRSVGGGVLEEGFLAYIIATHDLALLTIKVEVFDRVRASCLIALLFDILHFSLFSLLFFLQFSWLHKHFAKINICKLLSSWNGVTLQCCPFFLQY